MGNLSRVQQIAIAVACAVLCVSIGLFAGVKFAARQALKALPQIVPVDDSSSQTDVDIPAAIRVYVAGAVLRPDVYSLPQGCIVKDALAAAGGAAKNADLISVNLAAPLSDGEQITVPLLLEGVDGTAAPGINPPASTGVRAKISINRATLAELDQLPGIGPAKAQAIVDYRKEHGSFKRLEDLQNVSGIGTKTYEDLKSLISL
ncbi:MAG: helix-hairpin-helix domain-containing protein [Caldisericota bacterium]|nr:helix-hairpin-helix domain-containing protein [Caldisericota bacterium]